MNKFFKNWGQEKRAETIIEVLIALLVVTIGSATATSLILSSIRTTQFNKDSLLALNLAQEGLEYMRNLRDTNWMKFSGNTQGCWSEKPGVTSCNDTNRLAPATYALGSGADAAGNIDLKAVAASLDLSDGIIAPEDQFQLNYYDLNPAENSDGIDRNDSGGLDGAHDDYDFIGSWYTTLTRVDPTKYYRSIEISYYRLQDVNPWGATATTDQTLADLMVVTSTVTWNDAGMVHKVSLNTALTRYK